MPAMGMGPGPRGLQGSQKKGKIDVKTLGKLVLYCKKYLPAVILATLMAVGGAITSIIGPENVSDLTNEISAGILGGINMDNIKSIGLKLALIYGIGFLLNYGQQFISATVTQYTTKSLRSDIEQKINRLPLRYFDTTTKGDILSRVTNDVDTISQTLSSSMANLLSALALFAGVTFKMFDSNVILALITIGTSVIGFAFIIIVMGKSQKYFNRKQECLGKMSGQTEEVYTNHLIVKAFGGKKQETEVFNKTNKDLYDCNWKAQFISGMMMPVMTFVGNLAYALIFIAGVSLILNGSDAVTIGTIMAFVLYAKLFSQPLSTFAQALTSLQQASAASKRVFELFEQTELEDESGKESEVSEVKGDVEFCHVSFGYHPDKTIIHDFNSKLKAGQKVAIVGPTGAGKTTMVNLLMRFYEVDSGDILIDGRSIRSMTREDVHDLFDMILQDTWLFNGTIRENLIYNNQNVPDAKVMQAVEAVGLRHFIETLPQGLDTVIDDSLNLSEGQKQQMTIARAIIKDAPLLILDEATSSVDTRTELVIQKAMDELTQGRTSFIIAHRLSTIRNADVILVMRDGDIVEQGTHTELLEKNGFYADLYNSQFEQAS